MILVYNLKLEKMKMTMTEMFVKGTASMFNQFKHLTMQCNGVAILAASLAIFLGLEGIGPQNIHWVL